MTGWTHWRDARHGWSESRDASFKKAADIARKVIALDDQSASAYYLLGSILLMQRDYDDALAYCEKAVSLNPKTAYIQAAKGAVLTYLVRPEEAIIHYRNATRLSPFRPAWYLSRLGVNYHLQGLYEEAIEALKKGIEREPEDYFIRVRLAAVYSDLGQEEEVRKQAAAVLRLKPDSSIETYARANPFKDSDLVERRKNLLRKAGLK